MVNRKQIQKNALLDKQLQLMQVRVRSKLTQRREHKRHERGKQRQQKLWNR